MNKDDLVERQKTTILKLNSDKLILRDLLSKTVPLIYEMVMIKSPSNKRVELQDLYFSIKATLEGTK